METWGVDISNRFNESNREIAMNKEELYNEMMKMVPVKSDEKKDFREVVKSKLQAYRKLLNLLNEELPADWNEKKDRVNQLCEGINRAIESEAKGIRHSAYTTIKNQLDGYKSRATEIKELAYDENILTIDQGTVTYRMRKVDLEEQRKLKPKDMFHIPLDKRGLVETQRYSVPGYPCLYLAHSVYGCWEEMGRPDFGTIMVSKFVSQTDFKVLDLRIPSREIWNANMEKCVLFFPLVIASMVQVKNSKDTYKPEYLIPQLLTEWVISHNRDNKPEDEILGIMYTSAQKNDDFDFPSNSFDNFAIPVLKPLGNKKYCTRLEAIFQLTAPTYYDLEVLRNGVTIDGGVFVLEDEGQKVENMRTSHFGEMERFLDGKMLETVTE